MNDALSKELISMANEDSATRERLVESGEFKENEYHPVMRSVHEKNNERIEQIIAEYGWPGITLVGEEGANAAWFLVQHAVLEPEFQERCVGLLSAAVAAGEAKGFHLAMLHDRVLIRKGQPQVYGSQHEIDHNGKMYPLPITDPERVDERRKAVGLEPLAERTQFLQKDYERIKRNQENRRSQNGR